MAEINIIMGVYGDVRVWADRKRIHKMGWLRRGDWIRAVAEYNGWYRFVPEMGCCEDLLPTTDLYPDYWVNIRELDDADDTPEPGPVEFSDAELGAALRLLVEFLKQ